jgi:hypothetical protein
MAQKELIQFIWLFDQIGHYQWLILDISPKTELKFISRNHLAHSDFFEIPRISAMSGIDKIFFSNGTYSRKDGDKKTNLLKFYTTRKYETMLSALDLNRLEYLSQLWPLVVQCFGHPWVTDTHFHRRHRVSKQLDRTRGLRQAVRKTWLQGDPEPIFTVGDTLKAPKYRLKIKFVISNEQGGQTGLFKKI